MYHRQLSDHRRNRNIVLGISWLLIIGGLVASVWSLVAGLLLVNGYAFTLMAHDKRLAKKGGFRIPEASLFLVAGLGGGIGALAGMFANRHKTKHPSFLTFVPLFSMLQVFLLYMYIR